MPAGAAAPAAAGWERLAPPSAVQPGLGPVEVSQGEAARPWGWVSAQVWAGALALAGTESAAAAH